MDMKKTIGAIVAGYVVQFGGNFLIHGVWLKKDYIDTASLWRSPEAMNSRMWAMFLGVLIYAVGAVLIYVRGVESKPWVGQGIRFGILLALVTTVCNSLISWVTMPMPHMLAVKWMVGEGLLAILFGLVVAAICRPKAAAA